MKKTFLFFTIMLFTASMAYGAALSEGFEGTFPPDGWTNTTITGHAWEQSSAYSHGGTKSALYAGTGYAGYTGELITPRLDLTASGSDELTFWIKNADWYGDQNVCKVYISTDGGSTYSLLATYDTDISAFEQKTLDLETGITQTDNAYIKFWGEDNYGYGVYIDDVAGPELYVPACPKPTGLTTTSITATSASLGWTEAGTADTWDIEWGATGFSHGSGTMITGTQTRPYPLSGLTANTTYDWYVRADCAAGGGTGQSTWTGASTFTTLCAPYNLPIVQGFNAATIPACWSETVVADPGTDPTLTYVTSGTNPACSPDEGTHMVKFNSCSCYDGAEIRLESPEFSTSGMTAARVLFAWHEDSGYSTYLDEGVTVQWSLDGSTWNSGTFYQRYNATNGWYDKIYDLPAGALGQSTVYIGFLFHSQYGNNCYFDDVTIQETPSCVAPSALTETDITLKSAKLNWTENGTAITWEYEYGVSPYSFTGSGTSTGSKPVTLSGLTPGETYDWGVRADCGGGSYSTWTNTGQFTADDGKATNPDPADGAIGVLATATTLDWDDVIGADSYTIDIGTTTGGHDLVDDGACPTSTYPYGSNWDYNTQYFWTVTTVYTAKATVVGDEWDFTTTVGPHSFPLTEDFESGFTYFDNAPGNDVDWTISTTYHHSGSKCAYNDYTVFDENIMHETGILDLSATTKPMLYFWHIAKTEGGYDKCYIQISTDGGQNYTTLPNSCYEGDASGYSADEYFDEDSYTIWTPSGAIPDNSTWWKKETFDLSGYKQANVRFRFRLTSDSSGKEYGWLVDDIEVKEAPAKDIAVNSASIALPSNVWCYYQGGSYTVSAVIENKGSESDPTSVTLTYKEGSEPANEDDGTKQVFSPTWAKGNTATCTFTTQWSPASTGDKTVYVKSFYPGDGNTGNDVASKTVNVKAQYTLLYESFEDEWETSSPWGPPNWSESNIAAGTTLGQSNWVRSSNFHQEGSYSTYVPFYSGSAHDDWLISPAIDLTANTSKGASQLSYWIRFSSTLSAGDYLYVKISTDGGATWSATLKTYDDTNTSGMTSLTWQGIDLAAYSVQSNVKIGFYGDSNANESNYCYIDVVKIAPETVPTAATNPDPSDTDTNVAINTNLTWSNGGGATSYDVYLGTDNPPTNIVNGTNQAGTTYDPASDLAYNTTHYWRIDAKNAQGTTAGDVWSFTTQDNPNYGGGGAGTGGYYFANSTSGASGAASQPSYSWIDVTTNDVIGLLTDDNFIGPYPIGFTFNFYGNDYTQFYINSNGMITFGSGSSDRFYTTIPTAAAPNDFIAWFWGDLNPTDPDVLDKHCYYGNSGGNLVVSFVHYPEYNHLADPDAWLTAQIILYSGSDPRIKLQYKEKGSSIDLTICTVGIENLAGDAGVQYLYDGTGGPIFAGAKAGEIAVMFGTNENTLPVVLSTFTAQFLNNVPTLYWRTESETDNLGWFVYRNIEENFTTAERVSEFIKGHGTTTQQQPYIYEDSIQNPEVGDTYYYWLESIDLSGMVNHYDKVASLVIPDDYEPTVTPEIPLKVGLYQNYPNPFNPAMANTKICFYLGEGTNANVEIKVYNIKGELVKTIWNQYTEFEKSPVPSIWDGCDDNGKQQASGIYFYRMRVDGNDKEIKKLLLVK